MKLKAIVSSVALACALSFPGAAVAQDVFMLNDEPIPEDMINSFRGRCQALVAESNASLAEPTNIDETVTGSIGDDENHADSDPAARDNWQTALASVTIEECRAAGLAP